MEESILTSIKKLLGIEEEYEHFDPDIIIGINTALNILTQLGVGPIVGFSINDKTTNWKDFIPDISKFEMVKTYIHLKTKLLFDPPMSAAVIDVIKLQIQELEWRLNNQAESVEEVNVSELLL